MHEHDETWMGLALELASRGRGRVEPNPMVGAVLVRGDREIGQGWHNELGGPHAEAAALADAAERGHDPAGATMYVTLEPCRHHGRTPPCTRALIEAGVRRVVVAMVDPAEHAAGQGLAELREAGIDVSLGACEARAHELAAAYLKRLRSGLPWVILKWAQTLDGKSAAAGGESQWISGEASRGRVHELRARVDAIIVGIGTVAADNPNLTARDVPRLRAPAARVVVDPQLRIAEDCQLLQTLEDAPVLIAADAARLEKPDEKVLRLEAARAGLIALPRLTPAEPSRAGDAPARPSLDLRPLLAELAEQHDATNVLVEGGPHLAGSILNQGLVDEIQAFIAPRLAGDAQAISAVTGRSCAAVDAMIDMRLAEVERIESDVLLRYVLSN